MDRCDVKVKCRVLESSRTGLRIYGLCRRQVYDKSAILWFIGYSRERLEKKKIKEEQHARTKELPKGIAPFVVVAWPV